MTALEAEEEKVIEPEIMPEMTATAETIDN